MALIEMETLVAAPRERCFDLSRSVDLHLESAAASGERVVEASTAALLGLGDTVTWEARHLGLRHRLSVRITQFERPRRFRDEMISGPFRSMRHDHLFDEDQAGTRMRDVFEFSTGVPPFDSLILAPHLRRFLVARNKVIREIAEGSDWRRYLADPTSISASP